MNIIFEGIEKEEFISLYDDKSETFGFYSGKICSINDEHILLEHFDSMGRYSGYILLRQENIFRVNRFGKYENSLNLLSEKQPKKHNLTVNVSTIIEDLLEFAKKEQLIILIELCESGEDDIQGIVSDFNNDIINVNCVDDYGVHDGTCTCYCNDISLIKCDTTPCQQTKLLMNNTLLKSKKNNK